MVLNLISYYGGCWNPTSARERKKRIAKDPTSIIGGSPGYSFKYSNSTSTNTEICYDKIIHMTDCTDSNYQMGDSIGVVVSGYLARFSDNSTMGSLRGLAWSLYQKKKKIFIQEKKVLNGSSNIHFIFLASSRQDFIFIFIFSKDNKYFRKMMDGLPYIMCAHKTFGL